jgi:DHA2 family multidrug resistance protein
MRPLRKLNPDFSSGRMRLYLDVNEQSLIAGRRTGPGKPTRNHYRMSATAAAQGGLFTISGRQWLILLMVQLANMLFGMTITLANLVLPQMRGALSATPDEISWVITLNLVATAVATPLTGWLSARLGWRNLMFGTVLGFTVASLLCGIANSLEALIFARVLQGMFGAPIMPMGQAILLGTFPRHLHPTALVMWGVGAVFGPVLGPILGSIATEAYDWRAAFFMIVPPGVSALVCIWFALSEHSWSSIAASAWTGSIRTRSCCWSSSACCHSGCSSRIASPPTGPSSTHACCGTGILPSE